MAMGNYCTRQYIECPYATVLGKCQDDLFEDFNICEMKGDYIPEKFLTTEERRYLACHRIKWENDE